jgi:glutamate-5-semialdehyde dehydrogenase
MSADLIQLVTDLARRARAASLVLATASTGRKNAALARLAELLPASTDALLAANARDLAAAKEHDLTAAQIDRLTLDAKRIAQMAEGVRQVAALPDPVGEELEHTVRPNGLAIRKLRVPIGVIGIIYEARPNVTIDCAVLCLKSGNAAILRGGKEIFHTNQALLQLIRQALTGESAPVSGLPSPVCSIQFPEAEPLPADAVQLVPTTDRAALTALLKLDSLIHCIIPRGGESLIRFVAENSTIPVIKHFKGVCFVYVDGDADPAMAEQIVVNAKVQRPGVCNAAEQLLVHAGVAGTLLPRLARALIAQQVELRCDPASAAILHQHGLAHRAAAADDFTAEFLGLIMGVRLVSSVDEAIATINRDSSAHSDAIVTRDAAAAQRFFAGVDSATVFWNASTRFNDGFEFGLGAEIGISTDRLHARGPMGLRELCSYKYVITGTGQVRT